MITVAIVDGAEYWKHFLLRQLSLALGDTLRETSTNPQIVIFSWAGKRHESFPQAKRIMVSGEAWDCSRKPYDLLIDCKDVPRLRRADKPFIYYPFYCLSFHERYHNTPKDLLRNKATLAGPARDRFCAFLYHHDVDFRNRLFDVISTYKKVDALGKCRAAKNQPVDRNVHQVGKISYLDLAVQKYARYRFVICSENAIVPGYITEKLLNAMLAGAVPIYYGSPEVVRDFNPKSFIYVNEFPSFEACAKRIAEVDQNESLYQSIRQEPFFIDGKLSQVFNEDYLMTQLHPHMSKLFRPRHPDPSFVISSNPAHGPSSWLRQSATTPALSSTVGNGPRLGLRQRLQKR